MARIAIFLVELSSCSRAWRYAKKLGIGPAETAQGWQQSFRRRTWSHSFPSPTQSRCDKGCRNYCQIGGGQHIAAVRILCSENTPAEFSIANLAKLHPKHPPEHADARPLPNSVDKPALQVTEEAALKAIRSFHAGFVGGPDGFRPQHLLDLVQSQESGKRLLTSVTSSVNFLLEGKCHENFVHILFESRLLAMDKKSGSIRRIVVGYVWKRWLAMRQRHAIDILADYFTPLQMGVAVPGGFEAAVHATRRFLSNMPDEYIIAKLNISNAFNCLHRTLCWSALMRSSQKFTSFVIWLTSIPLSSLAGFISRHDKVLSKEIRWEVCSSVWLFSQSCILFRSHSQSASWTTPPPWWPQIHCLYGRWSIPHRGSKIGPENQCIEM